jgi:hypothetical protein
MLLATALPALSLEVRQWVPAGASSVTVVTIVAFPNGNVISDTASYCPAGSWIYINLPDGGPGSSSVASGMFFDAWGNEIGGFAVDPSQFVDDPSLGTGSDVFTV